MEAKQMDKNKLVKEICEAIVVRDSCTNKHGAV
jgi:hypothetical protein